MRSPRAATVATVAAVAMVALWCTGACQGITDPAKPIPGVVVHTAQSTWKNRRQ